MLEAYRVLDLSDEKGQLCGRVLGDLGADVIIVEPPGGSSSRNYGPFFHDDPDPEKSLSWLAFNANKRGITLDLEAESGRSLLTRLVRGAHFLVESYPPGYLDRLGLGYAALNALNPGLIMVSITPFGQEGPRAHWVTSDIVSMAMGGIMYIAGEPDNPPVRISAPQAYCHAGAQAAAAALIAHHHRMKTGEGQHVDVSIQEAVMWANSDVPQYWDMLGVNRGRGSQRNPLLNTARTRMFYPCKDGYISFSVGIGPRGGPNVHPLIQWMDREGKADSLGEMKDWTAEDWLLVTPDVLTQEKIGIIEAAIADFFQDYTKLQLHEFSSLKEFRLYMVSSPKDLVESPQLAARGYLVPVDHPELGATFAYPGSWARSTAGSPLLRRPAPRIGEHNKDILIGELGLSAEEIAALAAPMSAAGTADIDRTPSAPRVTQPHSDTLPPVTSRRGALDGVRVIEFAWVASGPTIGKHLVEHGAQVIRVESTTRIDALRNLGPFKDGVVGLNRCGFYARYNPNKLGTTLDLGTRRGLEIVRRLIAKADIVTESFSAGTIGRLGLGYRALRAINPRIIMLSTNIHGQTGPWADQGGAGAQGAAVAGIIHFTGWPDQPPLSTGTPYSDYVSPSFGVAALMAALDHRERTGEGQYIDLSQVECASQFIAPAILDYTANGRVRTRRGNRSSTSAPHNVYRCQGNDRWCAIAVRNEAQWQAFCQVLGAPEWTADSRFATMAGRLAHQNDLDRLVEGWTAGQTPEEVAEQLQAVGVPAGIVMRSVDLLEDPQLAARDHFVFLEHPEIGRHAVDRMSYRFSKTPGRLEQAAPCLGEHNERVMREVLELSWEELEQAVLEGVFG